VTTHLKAGGSACLVGFEQGIEHYAAVARRLNCNLLAHAQAGSFTYVDAFSQPLKGWGSDSPPPPPAGWGDVAPPPDGEQRGADPPSGHVRWSMDADASAEAAVRSLLDVVCREASALRGARGARGGCCIVVDSLSSLLALADAPVGALGTDPHQVTQSPRCGGGAPAPRAAANPRARAQEARRSRGCSTA
jgi:hypothetical protein